MMENRISKHFEYRISRDFLMEEDYLFDRIREVYEEDDEHPSDFEIQSEIDDHRMYDDMGTGETLWGKYQIPRPPAKFWSKPE